MVLELKQGGVSFLAMVDTVWSCVLISNTLLTQHYECKQVNMRFLIYVQSTLYLSLLVLLMQMIQKVCSGQAVIVAEKQRLFADTLTHELYRNDNECTSSWGVSMVFDLLRPGSSGETLEQICQVVGLCGSQDELLWNNTVAALTSSNTGECIIMDEVGCYKVAPLIKIANSIWIDIESNLQPRYSKIVGEESLQQTDFASQDAGGVVNSWVNSSSMGLIDSIVDEGPIFPPIRLLAINSIYLKAYWQHSFSERLTNEDIFYKDASRVEALPEKAHFMHTYNKFLPYSDTTLPGYQVVALKYQSAYDWPDDLSMIFVLPLFAGAASVLSDDVINALPLPNEVDPTEERPNGRGVALAIPKFRIEARYETTLENSLMNLGLTAPFDINHGFCGLLEPEECLFISQLIQKTFIEVNEEGTTAAAVTFAALAGSAPPKPESPVLFLADHPFQFFIYDSKEDLVLFEGLVGAPSIPDDWPPAQLQAVHSDPGFWTSNFNEIKSPPFQPTPPSNMTVQPTQPSTTQTPTHSRFQTTQPNEIFGDSGSPALPRVMIATIWIAVSLLATIANPYLLAM